MATTQDKTNVLFCCLGNICRSTMAEGVFRSIAKDHPKIGQVDSCGTGAYHTLEPPNYRTMDTLKKHGITDYEHGARQVTKEDFTTFDYIFAMDVWNLQDLQKMQRKIDGKGPKSTAKVMLFGEFNGKSKAEPVEDPYYGPDSGLETVYNQVKNFSENFLKSLEDGTST